MKVISRYLSTLALLLVLVQTTGVLAQSVNTQSVQGRAPVATGVTLNGPAVPLVGDTLQGTYGFNDPDLDGELGSVLRWLNDGDSELASGGSYILTDAERGKQVRFAVTPATDPAVTEPHQGNEVISLPSAVVQGRPDPAKSSFTVDKSTIVADGVENAVLTLTLKDSAGTPVIGIGDRVALEHSGIAGAGAVILTEGSQGGGVYEYILTGTTPGIETLTPQLDGASLISMPPSLQVSLVDPVLAAAEVVQLVTTTDNKPADGTSQNIVTATVHNIDGNPLSGVTVNWQVMTGFATLSASTSTTNALGQAIVGVKSTTVGSVTVLAKVSSNTTDIGKVASSTFIYSPLILRYSTPPKTIMSWSAAYSYCESLGSGYRLPTRDELQKLFVDATSASAINQPNRDMCNIHGWPLDTGCGGSRFYYWTSEAYGTSTTQHYGIHMYNGNAYGYNDTTQPSHVACIH